MAQIKTIPAEHIGDGLYFTDTEYTVDIAVNHHNNIVAVLSIEDIDKTINYLERIKKARKNG